MEDTTRRWELSSITREEAAQQTAIALALPSINLRELCEVSEQLLCASLTIEPLEFGQPSEVLDTIAVIIEHDTGERLAVCVPEPIWHAALDALISPVLRTSVPLEAERGALLYAASQLAYAALDEHFFVAGITTTAQSLCAALGLSNTGKVRWCARARVSIGDAHGNVALVCNSPMPNLTRRADARLAHVSVLCMVSCGETVLRTSEVRAIGKGDVVLLDRFGVHKTEHCLSGSVRLTPIDDTSIYWECVIQEGELTLVCMKSDSPSPPTSANLYDLPVRLHVELARVPMTFGELEALSAGQVLRLAKSTGDVVTLSANGLPIAEGEVVDIEGELGVRIVRLLTTETTNHP